MVMLREDPSAGHVMALALGSGNLEAELTMYDQVWWRSFTTEHLHFS